MRNALQGVRREDLLRALNEWSSSSWNIYQESSRTSICSCETTAESLAYRQAVTINAEGYRGLTGHVTGYAGEGRYRIFIAKHGLEMSFHISELKAVAP